uniref:Uncharacterized protein n=1 Tax=Octopus bimaculoides TaxID=37653 RepID=A0A0L8G824_OCTBM
MQYLYSDCCCLTIFSYFYSYKYAVYSHLTSKLSVRQYFILKYPKASKSCFRWIGKTVRCLFQFFVF